MGPQPIVTNLDYDDRYSEYDEPQGHEFDEGEEFEGEEDDRIEGDHEGSEGNAKHTKDKAASHEPSSTLSLAGKWIWYTGNAISKIMGICWRCFKVSGHWLVAAFL